MMSLWLAVITECIQWNLKSTMPDVCPIRLRHGTVHEAAQTAMDKNNMGIDSIL